MPYIRNKMSDVIRSTQKEYFPDERHLMENNSKIKG